MAKAVKQSSFCWNNCPIYLFCLNAQFYLSQEHVKVEEPDIKKEEELPQEAEQDATNEVKEANQDTFNIAKEVEEAIKALKWNTVLLINFSCELW